MANEKEKRDKEKDYQRFANAKRHHYHMFFSKPNVIAVDIGYRLRDGKQLDEMVVKVFVKQKIPKNYLSKEDLIPPKVTLGRQTFPVDVEVSDIPVIQLFTLKSRPLIGGASISALGPGNASAGTGTLGVCVVPSHHNYAYILSNDHVLTSSGNIQIGRNVTQPSLADGGTPSADDIVAIVTNRAPFALGTDANNRVDAALAVIYGDVTGSNFNKSSREIHWIGYPANTILNLENYPSNFAPTVKVHKMGRTTEYTIGKVISTSFDAIVDYSPAFGNPPRTNLARFIDQIKIEGLNGSFSNYGDSGSLVLDADTNRPVGLLFAGAPDGSYSIANHIIHVMQALSIERI